MNDSAISGDVQWSNSPVTFHMDKGESVELTESNTVATRIKDKDYGIVFTSEPMSVGQMLKVTVTQRATGDKHLDLGMVRAHLVYVFALPVYHSRICMSHNKYHQV